jgi:hypothetical protein
MPYALANRSLGVSGLSFWGGVTRVEALEEPLEDEAVSSRAGF